MRLKDITKGMRVRVTKPDEAQATRQFWVPSMDLYDGRVCVVRSVHHVDGAVLLVDALDPADDSYLFFNASWLTDASQITTGDGVLQITKTRVVIDHARMPLASGTEVDLEIVNSKPTGLKIQRGSLSISLTVSDARLLLGFLQETLGDENTAVAPVQWSNVYQSEMDGSAPNT